jgi:hypothetical protein
MSTASWWLIHKGRTNIVAGVIAGEVFDAAPGLEWVVGNYWEYLKRYASEQGWRVSYVCKTEVRRKVRLRKRRRLEQFGTLV